MTDFLKSYVIHMLTKPSAQLLKKFHRSVTETSQTLVPKQANCHPCKMAQGIVSTKSKETQET